MLISTKLHF